MSAVWKINEKALRWWGKEHEWYSLNEIAAGLDVAPSTLSRAINGKSAPGHELLASIRIVLGKEAFTDICCAVEMAS